VPATSKAYEFFLRANEHAKEPSGWDAALALYTQCLDQDPQYAPAWARLGRVYRLMAKYRGDHTDRHRALAEQALGRALRLNPDLSTAHNTLAQMEVESGQAREAMVRLLRQAAQISGDPELYAALCHVCRYCGLLQASVSAHLLAIRLDPKIATSVLHTWFLMGQYEKVIECQLDGTPNVGALSFHALGRRDDALAFIRNTLPRVSPVMRTFVQAAHYILDPDVPRDLGALRTLVTQFKDPEGLYYMSRTLSQLGELESAALGVTRSVDRGYFCYPTFASDSWLDPLRGRADFDDAMERARRGHEAALADFAAADGERLLGVAT
jgi:tetratricopeptide (TPR) repeat protein